MKIVGATGFGGLWGLEGALHIRVTNSHFSIFDSFRDIRVQIYVFLKFVGAKVGVANFFLVNR